MTIKYHDVSHHNGDYHPTGPTAAKATEGTTFTDSQFTTTRSRTRAGKWPFIAYHWLHHTNIAGQVSHVIAVIGHGQPLMLDVEHGTDPNPDDPTLADVYAFADQYNAKGGLVTLAYIPKWYWSGHWGSPSMTGLNSRAIALISSQFDTRGYTDADTFPGSHDPTGWVPYGGVNPAIWQYTDSPIDTNAYKGTQAALADLWNGANGGNPDQPVTPPEGDDVGTVDSFSPAAIRQLLGASINASGTTLAFGVQQGQNTVLLQTVLGTSGPNVGQALQGTYQMVQQILAILNPAALSALVEQAVASLPSGIDVSEQTLQNALVAALKELAATPTDAEPATPPAALEIPPSEQDGHPEATS